MFAQNWLESVNMIFGTDTTTTATIMAILVLVTITLLAIMALKENRYLIDIVIILDFLASLGLTYIEWFPQLVGIVIAFIFAMFGAWLITKGG